MRAMPIYGYQAYTVEVYYFPESGGHYGSIFSLRQGAPFPACYRLPNAVAYQERCPATVVCKTIDESHHIAL